MYRAKLGTAALQHGDMSKRVVVKQVSEAVRVRLQKLEAAAAAQQPASFRGTPQACFMHR